MLFLAVWIENLIAGNKAAADRKRLSYCPILLQKVQECDATMPPRNSLCRAQKISIFKTGVR